MRIGLCFSLTAASTFSPSRLPMPRSSFVIDGLPLNPVENCVQRIERLVAESNFWKIPVHLQRFDDVIGASDEALSWKLLCDR